MFSHNLTLNLHPCIANSNGNAWAVLSCFNYTGWFTSQFVSTVIPVSVYLNGASDGLISDWAQKTRDYANGNIYEARGVNHNEETNTTFENTLTGRDEMRERLNEIWRRDDVFNLN